MPTTGPETSDIACSVASRGDIPSSMWCSTASTTTIASSTTRPIASTSPNSDSVLIEKPRKREEREGADQRHRHRHQRDERGAPVLQEHEDHQDHQQHRLPERARDLADALRDRQRRVEADFVVEAGRERSLSSRIRSFTPFATSSALAPGAWKTATIAEGRAVEAARLVIAERAQLHARHVAQTHHRARRDSCGPRSDRTLQPSPAGPARARCRSAPGPSAPAPRRLCPLG